MTLSRLVFVLLVAMAITDYKFNNGRLIEVLGHRATQFGDWVDDSLLSPVSGFLPNH